MKVIQDNFKKEIPESEKPKTITCPECKSVIEYSKSDLTLEFWRTEGWTNSDTKYRGFNCPCCNYQLGIETLYP